MNCGEVDEKVCIFFHLHSPNTWYVFDVMIIIDSLCNEALHNGSLKDIMRI